MSVSVIVPAYNEARRLPASLPVLSDALAALPGSELIVVDDGSTDGTGDLAEKLLAQFSGGRVVRLPWNCGKGVAVRTGVAAATGDAIVFMDADLASDVRDLPALLAGLEHAEIALGSRRLGRGVDRSTGRRLGAWAFNRLIRTIVDLDIADTQCGFKAFRGDAAKILFSLTRADGFGFDVEVLAIAAAIGYRIVEVPVRWSETPGGTFRIVRHTPAMVGDLVASRRYAHRSAGPGWTAPGQTPHSLTAYNGQQPDRGTRTLPGPGADARGGQTGPTASQLPANPPRQRPATPPGLAKTFE